LEKIEWTDEKERKINTKIAYYLNCHSWYRNTLMATKKREMNSCWDLDPIREGLYFKKSISMAFLKEGKSILSQII
jgi:hypothetical protein